MIEETHVQNLTVNKVPDDLFDMTPKAGDAIDRLASTVLKYRFRDFPGEILACLTDPVRSSLRSVTPILSAGTARRSRDTGISACTAAGFSGLRRSLP